MYTKSLEIVVAILCVIGAWWYAGHSAVEKYKAEQAELQRKADKEQQDKYDKLAGEYETLKLERATNAKTIIREVEKIVDRPVYRNVCMDERGVQLANEAIEGRRHSSESNAEMPAVK